MQYLINISKVFTYDGNLLAFAYNNPYAYSCGGKTVGIYKRK